jgi:hypothetical protein
MNAQHSTAAAAVVLAAVAAAAAAAGGDPAVAEGAGSTCRLLLGDNATFFDL